MAKKIFFIVLITGGLLHAMDRHRVQPTIKRARAALVTSSLLYAGMCCATAYLPQCSDAQSDFFCAVTGVDRIKSLYGVAQVQLAWWVSYSLCKYCRARHQKVD